MQKSTTHLKRRQLDRRLKPLELLKETRVPNGGWLRAIRESLGMSAKQAGKRASISQQSWSKAESSEAKGSLTLSQMKRLSEILDCKFVYVALPKNGSLDQIVSQRAKEIATRLMARTNETMTLENQSISLQEREIQIEKLAFKIAEELKSTMWENFVF